MRWFHKGTKTHPAGIAKVLETSANAATPILGGDENAATPVETSILGDLARLHPFSPVAVAVLQLLNREQASAQEIARLLQSDPAIAAETLAYVNSPLFPLSDNITELDSAVLLLGVENTRRLIATLALRSLLKSAPNQTVTRRLWRHSMATAVIAGELAPFYEVPPDLASTAGVLHDIGRVGLLSRNGADYIPVVLDLHENVEAVLAAEREACGMDHCAAGTFMCRVWALPEVFQEVTARHHKAKGETGICGLINAACAMADDMSFAAISHRGVLPITERIAECLPEPVREKAWLLGNDLEKRIAERTEPFDF